VGSILSGANFADIRHRRWASSLSVYLANTSVVVVVLSSVRVHEVWFGTAVFLETVCKRATETRRWNDNVIHILRKWLM
jgi:dolichol kinase